MEIVDTLVAGYAHPDIALNCGSMVRECTRHDAIVRAILFSDNIWLFFQRYVHMPNFEVSADAFATLRELLTRKKAVVCEFLEDRYDQVFEAYDVLLSSDNYVTRRQSLKLLGELLLERANLGVMMRFISSKNNLKQAMILLRVRILPHLSNNTPSLLIGVSFLLNRINHRIFNSRLSTCSKYSLRIPRSLLRS